MSAARRGGAERTGPRHPADRIDDTGATLRHDVVLRVTTHSDASIERRYTVPDRAVALDDTGFAAWLRDHVPGDRQHDLVSVLVIEEVLDRHGSIRTCTIERHRGSASGPLHGEPARITFVGAVQQVRLYRTAGRGTLREMLPQLDQSSPPARFDHLAGEAQAVRDLFGPSVRILDAREPTALEDLIGLTSVMHLRTQDGIEIDCGLGWHGTTPFVLRADFPRFGAPPNLPAADLAAIEVAAVVAGLAKFETRGDAKGAAVMTRSIQDGAFQMIRLDAGVAHIEPYAPGVPDGLLTADQTVWTRYAAAHEGLTMIDAYRDGRSENVFLLAGRQDGSVTRHLIDADGIEVWRAAADDTAAAALHRERVIGLARE